MSVPIAVHMSLPIKSLRILVGFEKIMRGDCMLRAQSTGFLHQMRDFEFNTLSSWLKAGQILQQLNVSSP